MTCIHASLCDTLLSGGAVVPACFQFGKISGKSVKTSSGLCCNPFAIESPSANPAAVERFPLTVTVMEIAQFFIRMGCKLIICIV